MDLSSAMTADTASAKHAGVKVNKMKQHQKVKKNIEIHTAQNYTLSETKQVD